MSIMSVSLIGFAPGGRVLPREPVRNAGGSAFRRRAGAAGQGSGDERRTLRGGGEDHRRGEAERDQAKRDAAYHGEFLPACWPVHAIGTTGVERSTKATVNR